MPRTGPEKKPLILVTASTFPRWIGDTEPAFVLEICRRLQTDFSVIALAPHARGSALRENLHGIDVRRFRYAPEWAERLCYEGGILANLRYRPWTLLLTPFFLASQALAVRRLLRTNNVALIHAHWLVPQGVTAAIARRLAGKKTPLLCTSHGGDLFALRGYFGRWLKMFAIRRSQAVSVVSSPMKSLVEATLAPKSEVSVIPMGTALHTTFVPPAAERAADELLFVGRLVEKKGVATLLDAFKQLTTRFPTLSLSIVGSGPEEPALREACRTKGIVEKVKFVGALPAAEVADRMRRCTLFVMPSLQARDGDQEGFGLTLVEAMGCACPVVASDLPAIRDILDSETFGRRVPPGDATSLADVIATLLDDADLRQRLGTAARNHVVGRFDWSSTTRRFSSLMTRLIAASRETP